jgi:hypothetical protein
MALTAHPYLAPRLKQEDSALGLRGLFYGELYLCIAKEKGAFYLHVFMYFACVSFGETVIGICIPWKNMSFVFR